MMFFGSRLMALAIAGMQLGLVAAEQLGSQIAVAPGGSGSMAMPANGPLSTLPFWVLKSTLVISARRRACCGL